MVDRKADNPPEAPEARELLCGNCGRRFIFRRYEQERFAGRGWKLPGNCMECNKAFREQQDKEREQRENQKWKRKKEEERVIFHERLKTFNVVSKEDIILDNDQVLYILGNGFDLMHGVHSSYYAFRDSLGKNSSLRHSLENFWTPEDIWADFEEALAHFDVQAMSGEFMVDNWLDIYDVYGEDAGAAEFFMAAEAAANPILTVCHELPDRFRKWIESLTIGTQDRPLRSMFRNGKVLCFNYTEFVEELYGVSGNHVCYIHGCRRRDKYHPKEKLVLGHMPGAGDDSYDYKDTSLRTEKDPYQRYLMDAAQDQVIRLIAESDESLTKNCSEIIGKHKAFFESLKEVQNIIVIGHSLSPVDWDYFLEVLSGVSDPKSVRWYFGCHGLHDLENLEALLEKLHIMRSDVAVFRTDDITVTPIRKTDDMPAAKNGLKERICTKWPADGKWSAVIAGHSLKIISNDNGKTDYEAMVFSPVSDAFFTSSAEYLFVIIRGAHPGILLFHWKESRWCFIDELAGIQYQSLINPRLCHVFLTDQTITFVYNNRVRIYALKDGRLISNRGVRGAGSYSYEGEDVSRYFIQRG